MLGLRLRVPGRHEMDLWPISASRQTKEATMSDEYIEIYLAKSREHGFAPGDTTTKAGKQEAARYCLVCGLIPFTAENVALVGDREFYMDGLPEALRKEVKDLALKVARSDWQYYEEEELDHLKLLKREVQGVYIRNSQISEVKIVERRIVKVETTFYVSVRKVLD